MTLVETGWRYGLIPPLQMMSLEFTSEIGCFLFEGPSKQLVHMCTRHDERKTYTIVLRDSDSLGVSLGNTIDMDFLLSNGQFNVFRISHRHAVVEEHIPGIYCERLRSRGLKQTQRAR